MARPGVHWTDDERAAVTAEGLRLQHAGKVTSLKQAFRDAQAVVPKNRRREVTTLTKVPWFTQALKAGASRADLKSVATALPASTAKVKVFWTRDEKRKLADEAARLIRALEASSPYDALVKAQMSVLGPDRRRSKVSPSSVADWYPAALKAAAQRQRNQEDAKPPHEPFEAVPPTEPSVGQQATSRVAVAVAPVNASFSTMLGGGDSSPWAALRGHLVQEIAAIVAEGVMRGLESVRLLAPQQHKADQPQEVPRHVPFVSEPAKPRKPSVLVVGLKGGTAAQIEADFKEHFDLRFCEPDKSKDHLRSMAEQADTTVAAVDFISHSHTDIIKARSKHVVISSGGMTALRQHLTKLAGPHANGHAHAAA